MVPVRWLRVYGSWPATSGDGKVVRLIGGECVPVVFSEDGGVAGVGEVTAVTTRTTARQMADYGNGELRLEAAQSGGTKRSVGTLIMRGLRDCEDQTRRLEGCLYRVSSSEGGGRVP
ncbi:hypothetical protein GUJ93_ZPchr0012g21050 [Zizania palustris]|uniref:Uncharacterized protein n=1 Tax=Zizania palustris TaxID=103762 RepID=A0A8J5WVI6_ZIZPA|nr:hypothetical protein GUJ93_ZPchr0012g21050 [Zizania palustris]